MEFGSQKLEITLGEKLSLVEAIFKTAYEHNYIPKMPVIDDSYTNEIIGKFKTHLMITHYTDLLLYETGFGLFMMDEIADSLNLGLIYSIIYEIRRLSGNNINIIIMDGIYNIKYGLSNTGHYLFLFKDVDIYQIVYFMDNKKRTLYKTKLYIECANHKCMNIANNDYCKYHKKYK